MNQLDDFSSHFDILRADIEEIKKQIEKSATEYQRKFTHHDMMLSTCVRVAAIKDLETALGDRVQMKKFRTLEATVATYLKQDDFEEYASNIETTISKIQSKFLPLAASADVDTKVCELQASLNTNFLDYSRKDDCA
jgi:hypothetical protein